MIELIDTPIDTDSVLSSVGDPRCGAIVLFVGTTRQWTKHPSGDAVETDHLHYEAYETMALKKLRELEQTARERWPVENISIVHRLGRVDPSEPSVAVAVSCPHRSEAFEAAHWLIDELKHQVPIWKQEHYVQTGSEWIHPTAGSCSCDHEHQVEHTHHAQKKHRCSSEGANQSSLIEPASAAEQVDESFNIQLDGKPIVSADSRPQL